MAAAAAVLGVAACAGGDPTATNAARPALMATVCDARNLARAGNGAGAKKLFVDRAHEPLHELAKAAGEADRAIGARLLEAKAGVEALTDASPSPDPLALAAALDSLADVTAAASKAAGTEVPACGA